MSERVGTMRKITVSLPKDLIDFADTLAMTKKTNRSEVIADALTAKKEREETELAAEGYRFYAQEAEDFAAASLSAVSEALGYDG